MPEPVRNAEPVTKFGGAFKLAVKFPLPQILVEVTKPVLVTVARFWESMAHCTWLDMSLVSGG